MITNPDHLVAYQLYRVRFKMWRESGGFDIMESVQQYLGKHSYIDEYQFNLRPLAGTSSLMRESFIHAVPTDEPVSLPKKVKA